MGGIFHPIYFNVIDGPSLSRAVFAWLASLVSSEGAIDDGLCHLHHPPGSGWNLKRAYLSIYLLWAQVLSSHA